MTKTKKNAYTLGKHAPSCVGTTKKKDISNYLAKIRAQILANLGKIRERFGHATTLKQIYKIHGHEYNNQLCSL
jgi:glycerol-3-phosphate O-acyltransferase